MLFVGGARFAIGLTLKSITEEFAIGGTVFGLTVAVYLCVTSACMFLACSRCGPAQRAHRAGLACGTANLGAISGLIVMIHHMCDRLGAATFDAKGGYDVAFAVMLAASVLASVLTANLVRK